MNERSFRLTVIALLLLIPIFVISVVIVIAATGGFGTGYWGPWTMMNHGWIFMLIPLTFLVILFVILILAAIHPTDWGHYHWGHWRWDEYARGSDAETILEERYARGEISRDDFVRMREDLRSGRR
ncbi:MAG: SHOCT domain-containing protein [Methanomassiliicoccales archaeon]|nr:SHOCT domain-containing protein [Methanomassiliicoccales archaeon]